MTTNKEREWIDADKLREVIEEYDSWESGAFIDDLRALFPTPKPRTLADTKWDDNVHPYMEAVTVSGRRHILLAPMGDTAVSENTLLVAEHDGGMPVLVPAEDLFPTGRYARLSLPDEQATEETLDPPRPEDVPEGEVWMIRDNNGTEMTAMKLAREAEMWDWVTTGGQHRADRLNFYKNKAVTLVSRLVPEVKGMTPQIVRTFEEVLALSPDTVMIDSDNDTAMPHDYIGPDGEAVGIFIRDLPAVVVASGDPVRAARRALEQDTK